MVLLVRIVAFVASIRDLMCGAGDTDDDAGRVNVDNDTNSLSTLR